MLSNFQNQFNNNGEEQYHQTKKQQCLNWQYQDQNSKYYTQQQYNDEDDDEDDDQSQEKESNNIFLIEPPDFCFYGNNNKQSRQIGEDNNSMMYNKSSFAYSLEENNDYFRKQSQKLRSFVDSYYVNDKITEKENSENDYVNQSQITLSQKQNNIKKKVLYQYLFKQQFTPERLISAQRKFYLYFDQMLDFDYFENINQPDQYINNNLEVQITKGFRKVQQVIHRVDNKFIEVDSDFLECQPQSIDYVVEMMKSVGNKDLINYVNFLIKYQKNIEVCKFLIKSQSMNDQFLDHRLERKEAGDQKFKKITSELDPTKLIFYSRYSINYEKCQYQSTKSGYSPALYEFLDNGSYSFKDKLLKEGYYDPMSQLYRQREGFFRTCFFLNELPSEFDPENLEQTLELDLITVDNFRFPVILKTFHYYLEQDYDRQNGLDLRLCDLIGIYEYELKDPDVLKNIKDIRKQNVLHQSKLETIYGENVDWDQFDYVQTDFFNKYYSEQVQNLVKKGNKWYKRCGFAEIPTKKVKK